MSSSYLNDPIAIIGMACRFPGNANTPEAFWQLLQEGVDAVIDIPTTRKDWDLKRDYDPTPTPGKFYVSTGAFLQEDVIEQFDTEFFGIAAREAEHLDPQQRLLLQVSWEALENAGIAPSELENTKTGVFVGIHWDDYSSERFYSVKPTDINAYATLSNLRSLAAGRISYFLNLQGPSMQIDAACSSGLVGVQLACQSLRMGESNVAIAGGVSLLLSPGLTIGFCQMNVLAKDGRCKTFSASADGFSQGEGCGVVVLKRLSDAMKEGDNILGIIPGASVNHDGRSLTLTTPSTAAQQTMLTEAIQNAGIKPADMQYIETHGTGTSLGDLIEMKALGNALGEERTSPLYLGSVKTNIGHLGAAAGIAGLMKIVLSMQHNLIPPNLHFDVPNPRLPWKQTPFVVPTEITPWPEGKKKLAGVSAFGMSGTNVHVIVEHSDELLAYQARAVNANERPDYFLFTLSAKNETSLRLMVQSYKHFLQSNTEASLANICYTATCGRDHFAYRFSVSVNSLKMLEEQLDCFLTQAETSRYYYGDGAKPPAKIAFLFTGQGSQYLFMGKKLYETQPVFRQALQQCDELLKPHLQLSLLSIIYPDSAKDQRIHQTQYTQPALFAFEYALAQLWLSWGIKPDVVMGHSVGEYVAACIAGVFSLQDALRLIAARGRLIHELASDVVGGMASIVAELSLVEEAIKPYQTSVSIAAINGPRSIVIAGEAQAVTSIVTTLNQQGVKALALTVSHAFHSQLLDPVLDAFQQVANEIHYQAPQITMVSNKTGQRLGDQECNADYWVRHMREPVRFLDGMQTLQTMGVKNFLEIGPSAVLLGMGAQCVADTEQPFKWLASMRPGQEWSVLFSSLGEFYSQGRTIHWKNIYPSTLYQKIILPNYAFAQQFLWVDLKKQVLEKNNNASFDHPLLQQQLYSSVFLEGQVQFQAQLSADRFPYLADHRIFDHAICPASAYLEMAVAGGVHLFKHQTFTLQNISIEKALRVDEEQTVQLTFTPDENGYTWNITRLVLEEGNVRWEKHAAGRISLNNHTQLPNKIELITLQNKLSEQIEVHVFYQQLAEQGINYGPSLQAVRRLWRAPGEALGLVKLDQKILNQAYHAHPALLDACFHLFLAALPENGNELYLPMGYDALIFHAYPIEEVYSHVKFQSDLGQELIYADLKILSPHGDVIVELVGCKLKKTRVQAIQHKKINTEWLYQLNWQKAPIASATNTVNAFVPWLLLADDGGFAKQLAALLNQRGASTTLIYAAECQNNDVDVWQNIISKQSYQHVIYLWNLNKKTFNASENDVALVPLVQALQKAKLTPRLYLVTQGAQSIATEKEVAFWQTPLWGLARTFMLEYPEFSTVCVDLAAHDDNVDHAPLLLRDLLATDFVENQIAYRQGERYIARLMPAECDVQAISYHEPVAIQLAEYGVLDQLSVAKLTLAPLQDDEIEIDVYASGLNFRDILRALGMMRVFEDQQFGVRAASDLAFGYECAGIVKNIGKNVHRFNVGDAVIGYGSNTMASVVHLKEQQVLLKPASISFAEAATLPVAYVTAYMGLIKCAHLQRGERILIHNAAGGVGQAAVQLAQHIGAEIFATAHPSKWEFLRSLGVQHVYNSRNVEFAEQIQKETHGKGVDVVFNSLNGDFIDKSVSVLNQKGRFVEIGKLLIWSKEEFLNVRPNATYHLFDLGTMPLNDIETLLTEMMTMFNQHGLKPLPVKEFSINDAVSAFRYMQQAKHIGKVALNFQKSECPLTRPEASYIITGGLGGLGLRIAEWLAKNGAKHLVLVGRSQPQATTILTINQLKKAGVDVVIAQVDIADHAAVEKLLAEHTNVRGVIHAAGIINDNLFTQQTEQSFQKVMMAKVRGTWNLHELTRSLPLDYFVCFSSIASLLGSAGQSNYSAANAFMDGLSHYRAAHGLASLTVNWGPWAEVGMAAPLAERLKTQGYKMIPLEEGLELLAHLIRNQHSGQVGVFPMDWARYLERLRHTNPVFEHVDDHKQSAQQKVSWIAELNNVAHAERRTLLLEQLRVVVRKVIGVNANTRIEESKSLFDLGLDSLMAVELKNIIEANVEQSLRSTLLFDYPTLDAIISHLNEAIPILKAPIDNHIESELD
ncbi:MAG: type I polyketide synthase, partial [Pseudomonadota bacterium]